MAIQLVKSGLLKLIKNIYFFILIISTCAQASSGKSNFTRKEYCQKSLFGKRKNLENKLLKNNLLVKDDFEFLSIEILLYLYDFSHLFFPEKLVKFEVNDKKLDNKKWFDPKWNNLIDQDLFDFNEKGFCLSNNTLYSHLTMATSGLSQLLLGLLFNQRELVSIINSKLKVKLISDTNLKSFNRDQELKAYHLVRILSDLSFMPKEIIEKLNLKYIIVLKEGYQQNDGLKVSFDSFSRALVFTESYFNVDLQIYENKEFLHAVGLALWTALDQKMKNKFIELGWINKNQHYYYKKNIGFVNDDARKNLQSDFVEHFYYYFFNGFFLKQSAGIKYLFFKNNFFSNYFYKSEIEKFEEAKRKEKNILNKIDYMLEPVNENLIKYSFIIKSSDIKNDIKIKNISFSWNEKENLKWQLSNSFFVTQNRISIRGILNKKELAFNVIEDPKVNIQLDNGQNLELSGFKQVIKIFDLIEVKKNIFSNLISLKIINNEMVLQLLDEKIENINLVWKTNDDKMITHFWDASLFENKRSSYTLKVHPFWGKLDLKLEEVYVNGEKIEPALVNWSIDTDELRKFKLIDSAVFNETNKRKYKFIFKNEADLNFAIGVFYKSNNKLSYHLFENVNSVDEHDSVKVEIKKNINNFVVWIEMLGSEIGQSKFEFISKFPILSHSDFLYNSNQEYKQVLQK